MLQRFAKSSDDPLGLVAWIALGFVLLVARCRFDHPPRARQLLAAAGVTLVAATSSTIAPGAIPDLLRALLVTIAIVLTLAAIVDEDEPFLPYAGFALLAWPWLPSLQFEGRLAPVDASCSGVEMVWLGCFTACFAAWLFRTPNRAAINRMPIVVLVILVGVVARNALIVALEVGEGERSIRQGIGLVTATVGCVVIVAVFARFRDRVRVLRRIRVESAGRSFAPAPVSAGLLVACGLFTAAALVPLATTRMESTPIEARVGETTRFDRERVEGREQDLLWRPARPAVPAADERRA
jgi:exosortase/archaeosortase family protein